MFIVKYNIYLLIFSVTRLDALIYVCRTLMKSSQWPIEAFPVEIFNDDDDDIIQTCPDTTPTHTVRTGPQRRQPVA